MRLLTNAMQKVFPFLDSTKKYGAPLLVVFLAIGVAGCGSRARWLAGQWRFDEQATRRILQAEQTAAGKDSTFSSFGGAAKQIAKGIISPEIIAELQGSEITVTDKDLILTSRDGTGEAFPYEVLSVPDPNTLTLKLGNGDVDTFHHEGSRLWRQSSGRIKIPVYYVKVSN